jgi:hypothetical protein
VLQYRARATAVRHGVRCLTPPPTAPRCIVLQNFLQTIFLCKIEVEKIVKKINKNEMKYCSYIPLYRDEETTITEKGYKK